MVFKQKKCRMTDAAAAFLMTAAVAAAAYKCGGFYYDLNDDVLIKDILAGVYSGSPDGHTMQILYPLGWLLSLLYYIPGVPVFGLFLCLCQFGAIYVIAHRTLQCLDSRGKKILLLLAQGIFWMGACLEHLVFLQYTVTAGMLGAAAVFWIAASQKPESFAVFFRENLPALILYWIAFCLRSEMGLLLLPLAGITGLCKWFSRKKPFAKENLTGYVGLFAVLMAGIVLCLGAEALAYGSDDWQEFSRYFDARTTVYDYQRDVVEDYGENKRIYEELGMSQTRQQLLKNYNFSADDSIDADFLEALAQKSVERENGGLFKKDLRTGIWELVFGHFLGKADFCLNAGMIFLGLLLFGNPLFRKQKNGVWQAVLVTGCAAALWVFLILRGRLPVRLTTPLYLTMAASFGGLLLTAQNAENENDSQKQEGCLQILTLHAAAMGLVLCGILTAPENAAAAIQQVQERQQTNSVNEAVMAYCSQTPDILYLADVYSTVRFSEKIGVDRDKPFNYDIMGGWISKSPLTLKKLQDFGLESVGEAVCGQENVRLLTDAGTDFVWLLDFLAEQGIAAEAVLTDKIADGAVEVYQIVCR